MLEDGEIDEEVSSSVVSSTAAPTRNHNPKKSPPKSSDNMNQYNKRTKLSSDDSFNDHSTYNNAHAQSNGYADWDDRVVATVPRTASINGASATTNSLMSIPMSSLKLVSKTLKDHEPAESTSSSGWLSPPKREPENAAGASSSRSGGAPPSIFDLITSSTLGQPHSSAAATFDKLMNFVNFDSNQMQTNKSVFVDPVITEKENKPKARNQTNNGGGQQQQQSDSAAGHKRKFNKGPAGSSSGPTFEISDKKAEKKRKYFEEHKKDSDRQKPFVPREREPIVCKFYMEGRCQKGDDCPFSHNVQLNKRMEICKYYLNGFCAKKDQCLYLHSEFPCKFYHRVNRETGQRRSDCLHGSQCRFSHEPIKNPMLKEAFEKYLAECDEAAAKGSGGKFGNDHQHSTATTNASNIPSLMTLPLAPAPAAIAVNTTGQRPLGSPNAPSSPPPLQTPLPLLSTSIMSLDRMTGAAASVSNMKATPLPIPARFQDVDERDVVLHTKPVSAPLLGSTGDIDERAISASVVVPPPPPQLNLNSFLATVKENASSYNADKEKLIGLVMKAIADDGSVFSQIPKQTLSELLLKLLQNKPENPLSHDTIKTLLATFTSVSSNPASATTVPPAKSSSDENGSHHQLMRRKSSTYSDYDDDDEDEGNLVIEGNVGEIPYKIYEIDIEPSSLWANPPSTSMTSLLAASLGNEDAIDQESDPRIKYYANKANLMNVANFQLQSHLQSQQQQQLLTPTSPSHASQSPSSSSTPLSAPVSSNGGSLSDLVKQAAQAKATATGPAATTRLDPRLARSMNQAANAASASPTRSLSPQQSTYGAADLSEAIQNLASSSSSNNLLASLPDFRLPKADQMQRNNNGVSASFSSLLSSSTTSSNQSSSDTSTVKLSIEDYKRKLQKPTNGQSVNGLTGLGSSNTNLSSLAAALNSSSASSSTTQQAPQAVINSPTIPGMPSMYSLQAPQSLHELLRNFQS